MSFRVTLKTLGFRTANVSHKSRRLTWRFSDTRVSTDGQTLASQDAELMAAGCAKVYVEKVSGARTDRAELAKVVNLERDDLQIVCSID
jgi:hypothetical protein